MEYYRGRHEPFKLELIDRIPEGEDLRMYWHGPWQDLCRGPHLQHTGQFWVLWPSSRHATAKLRVFIDHLALRLFPATRGR